MNDHATGPISSEQERMWRACRLQSDAAYNIASGVRIHGALNLMAVAQGVEQVMRRHITLRSYFVEEQARPIVKIVPPAPFPLIAVDLRRLDAAARERCGRQVLRQHAARIMPWDRPPLLSGLCLVWDPRESSLSCVLHHLIADSWSMVRFFAEFVQAYEACRAGRPAASPPLTFDYFDYARWRERWLATDECARQRRFWQDTLHRRSYRPIWDTGLPPAEGPRTSGGVLEITLARQVRSQLKLLERQWRATLFMVLQAALHLAIQRWTGDRGSQIAVVDASRRLPESEPLIGPFANVVLVEARHEPADTVAGFVRRSRDGAVKALANREYPFGRVLELIEAGQASPIDTVFQVAFVLQGLDLPRHRSATLSIEVEDVHNGAAKFPLTIYARDQGGDLRLTAEYASSHFDRLSASAFLAQYAALVRQMAARPDAQVVDLVTSSAAARHWARHELNDTDRAMPANLGLREQFQAAARRAPDRIALQDRRGCLTFAALASRAAALGDALTGAVADPTPEVIGIYFERSPQLVVAILGVLSAGLAFLPLNPGDPVAATRRRLERSGARRILCAPGHAAQVGEIGADVVPVLVGDDCRVSGPIPPAPASSATVTAEALYVMFTSGSTGEPKGAVLPRHGVDNRIAWMAAFLAVTPADRVLQKTPITFDVSMWELFLPLVSGCTLVLPDPDDHRDPAKLAAVMIDQQITIAHFVPSMAAVFCDEPAARHCGTLRHVVLSGEALLPSLLSRLRETVTARIHNLYGPTEASIDVTAWTAGAPTPARPPIGRPIWNTTAYILDERLAPVAAGVEGALYLGGVGLALGYVQAPALTAAAFVPDPFSARPGARLYRTGDRARLRPDGQIDFIGRRDGQVKVNGIRIELGEIEEALRRHPAVADAAAVSFARRGASPRIEAVAVPTLGTSGDLLARLGLGDVLTRFLTQELPFGALVSRVVVVDALPRAPSGKTDKQALARMLETGEIDALCGDLLRALEAMSDDDASRLLAGTIHLGSQ